MRIEKEGPGIAFWRAHKHGWDKWAYGLISIEIPEIKQNEGGTRDWSLGIRLPRFNMARPSPGTPWWKLHFNWFDFSRFYVGPIEIRFLYIEDRKN